MCSLGWLLEPRRAAGRDRRAQSADVRMLEARIWARLLEVKGLAALPRRDRRCAKEYALDPREWTSGGWIYGHRKLEPQLLELPAAIAIGEVGALTRLACGIARASPRYRTRSAPAPDDASWKGRRPDRSHLHLDLNAPLGHAPSDVPAPTHGWRRTSSESSASSRTRPASSTGSLRPTRTTTRRRTFSRAPSTTRPSPTASKKQ